MGWEETWGQLPRKVRAATRRVQAGFLVAGFGLALAFVVLVRNVDGEVSTLLMLALFVSAGYSGLFVALAAFMPRLITLVAITEAQASGPADEKPPWIARLNQSATEYWPAWQLILGFAAAATAGAAVVAAALINSLG